MESAGQIHFGNYAPWLFVAHLVATAFMAGLACFTHAVHYPLMRRIPHERFATFMEEHMRRTGGLVAPVMAVELATGAALWWLDRGGLLLTNLVLIVAIWLLTFVMMWPNYRKLCEGFDEAVLDRLLRANAWRTRLWLLHSVVAVWVYITILQD